MSNHLGMRDNVYKFRTLKWGEPKKFKVLVEDLEPKRRPNAFVGLVIALAITAFGAAYLYF